MILFNDKDRIELNDWLLNDYYESDYYCWTEWEDEDEFQYQIINGTLTLIEE